MTTMPYGWERAVTAALLLAIPAALHALSGMFYRYEYYHADEYGPLDWYLDLVLQSGPRWQGQTQERDGLRPVEERKQETE